MPLSVEDLQREIPPEEVRSTLETIQDAFGLPVASWRPGAVVRTINRAVSYVFSGFSRMVTTLNRSAFFDTAAGGWLDLRVHDVAGPDVARIPEGFARGPITIDNAGGGLYSFAPGELVVIATALKKTYVNVELVEVGPLETGVVATVQATEAGSASTAAPGQIDDLQTTALGLSVTNPAALVGSDAETDEAFRVRARESYGRLSPNGPRDAYAYFAKSTQRPDGTTIAVNRVKVSSSGVPVIVYVASPQGVVAGDKDTSDTDVWHLQQSIDRYVVPDGVEAEVYSATPVTIAVTGTLYLRRNAGIPAADAEAAAELKLTEYFAHRLPIGGDAVEEGPGFVFRNALIGILEALEIEGIADAADAVIKADLAAPAADVEIDVNEVPVLGTVTLTVELV